MSENPEKELLLHTCCGPCASGCIGCLFDNKRHFTMFFSNSNLADAAEYERRLEAAKMVAEHYGVDIIADPYEHDAWLRFVSQLPDYDKCPERGARCRFCFQFSLMRTEKYATAHGMNFATTLTVSPHKSSPLIFEIGSVWPNFEPWNFKKNNGFGLSIANSKALNLYRQNFCGCEFSRAERLKQDELKNKEKGS